MGLFGKTKTADQKATVCKVTVFTKMIGFDNFMSIGGLVSPEVILTHMDAIRRSVPSFADEVVNYMRDYEVCVVTDKNLPDPNDLKALEAYAKRRSARSKIEPRHMCIRNSIMQNLYVIEYGEPDPKLKHDADMAKTVRSIIFARSPLDPKYEKYAQDIVRAYKKESTLENKELRKIGEQINDFDKMVLVAHRAERIAFDEGIRDFTVRFLEYTWDGIAGWMK